MMNVGLLQKLGGGVVSESERRIDYLMIGGVGNHGDRE